MTFTLPTLTLLARELEGITDRLELLHLWLKAAALPDALRHVPRDLATAADSFDIALMDVREAIAVEVDARDAGVATTPPVAGDPTDEPEGDDDLLGVGLAAELAELVVPAAIADPDRTRAVLRDIADAGVVTAPGETVTTDPDAAGTTPPAPVVEPPAEPVADAPAPLGPVIDAGEDDTPLDAPTWWVEDYDEPGGRHRKPDTDEAGA